MRSGILAALCFCWLLGQLGAAEAKRPTALFLIGEDEYDTQTTLPRFARVRLEPRGIRCQFVHAHDDRARGFPGIEALAEADLLVLSVRRRTLPVEQMEALRKYVASGKPIVAMRTSSHAFALREGEPPPGHAAWPEFDREVLGGHYTGHYGAKQPRGANTRVWSEANQADHPILQKVDWTAEKKAPFTSWLYKSAIVSEDVTVLAWGETLDEAVQEPVAWTNTPPGQRRFYTSLGHPDDFRQPAFEQLLTNAVVWSLSPAE